MHSPIFSPTFQKDLQRYGNIKERVRKRVEAILAAPYDRTELLQEELKGLRSARIGRNFRIIFAVSEEISGIAEARKNFPKFCGYPKDTVIFITVGPHEKAYGQKGKKG